MFQQKQQLSLKYLPSLRMQQGLRMLQSPLTELSSYITQEIIHNPFLDLSSLEDEESSFSSPFISSTFAYLNNTPAPQKSLYTHILSQIDEIFSTSQERLIAHQIAGNLSDQGLFLQNPEDLADQLELPLNEIYRVWNTIQNLNPLGIASPSLQSYWMRLLRDSSHQKAYTIIRDFYPLITNCEFLPIMKKLRLSLPELLTILKKALGTIPWSPAAAYTMKPLVATPLPDIYLFYHSGSWDIKVSARGLPSIKLNRKTFDFYEQLPKEEQNNLTQQILSAKWLIKNLRKREETLLRIMESLLPKQEKFLLGNISSPEPVAIKSLAEDLALHESTIFRAIENKVIATPIGIFPLKRLFPKGVHQDSSHSKEKILQWIYQWISTEQAPLSDRTISDRITAKGIPCARRTVAKYRSQLNILPANKRKMRLRM
ncbi:RNA polymerase factor sigma-54,DNA-directed RNA polymerase specialized sigma subunit, sigma54 homolog,RNA polymerase sigma-54 factor,Sigma-54, DNA binding domain [Chlamydia serpentis]|uniref:RNA polymerase factor sigma-54,DNA-directed RNA polymerase specialized sigma subunit, sigma54 homolog,RNA polymerase sigma-54 factor,Sigma-54, DNA binding domain n=1 Tax=Chlamydia serpentis TaxID=1967782 RepID=A0A2R8FC44_9CHLA|nr:RNA polymerase factor sigma-54 [Chlamydia serpentis]SPN73886.1 RNA polymerase factor sigma-54,DNA-directed RNA polymerase specialized sigma subunit, sigma54 homolog,RNA polymerase sigma-54 factor,Sigma-54, DNA binding domain [Chlamydia serpentis]